MSATMFKAVVWKELRENLKWAVVVLLGMAVALTFAIPSLVRLLRGQVVDLDRLATALDATTTIGGLLAGLLIGAAQTVVENRGDKWGFLAHRPIGRTTLFWGKAIAGILLYVMATGLPVAAALSWIASPRYLPIPFDWRMALPAVANLLCGLVFYFAGFLTGMREAKWYVSRAMGIGAAFCCLIFQMGIATTFWQAAAASAAGLILLGTAAWSTFVAGGRYGVQPRIGRVATGISIGLGIMLVGGLVFTVNLMLFQGDETPRVFRYSSYAITADGVVVRITTENGRGVEVSDPSGRPLERYQNSDGDQIRRDGVPSARLSKEPQAPPSFRSIRGLFSLVHRADNGDPVSWYYVHRLGLLAAYDSQTRKLTGWMGPDGFSLGKEKTRPFAGRLKGARSSFGGLDLLVFEDAIHRVDLDAGRVEKIFQSEPAETLLDAGAGLGLNPSTIASFGMTAEFEVIWTTRRVIVQLRDGTRILETPQDAKVLGYSNLQVSRAQRAPGIPTFLWYQRNIGGESRIAEFNSAGVVTNSWTLPATNPVSNGSRSLIVASSAITPLIGHVADFAMQTGSPPSRPDETARWTIAIVSALISAAAAFLHGRRYAFPPGRLRTWTGIAFLLGPLGYLMMLALIEWPARESCPACSRKRVVTRHHCEHCGEPFAAPPQDGTEIFEPTK